MFYLVIVAVILCILFKILNVNNSAEKSLFYCKNQKFLEEFLKRAPELELPYVPTRFWGFSGHIQTIIQVRTYIFICIKWIDLMAKPSRGMQQSQMKNAIAEKKSKSTTVTMALRTGVG